MVEQNFWEMLRAKHDSLTKSGTIVADYLVQHAEDAPVFIDLLAGKGVRRGRGHHFPLLPLPGV